MLIEREQIPKRFRVRVQEEGKERGEIKKGTYHWGLRVKREHDGTLWFY